MNKERKTCMKRRWFPLLLLLFCLLTAGVRADAALSLNTVKTAAAGKFVQGKTGAWYYQYTNRKLAKNTLLKIGGKIYYFSKQGYRLYDWQKIKGQQYYFGTRNEGYMYRNRFVKTKKGNYYYLLADGTMAKGLQTINKKQFLFNAKTGVNLYGWQKVNGKLYYFGIHGKSWLRRKMLVRTGNDTYYVKADGTRATGWITTGGIRYFFGKNYKAYTGKHTVNGTTYYFRKDGALISSGADLTVTSECAYLYDMTAKKVIYDKNGKARHANASTTKIMTCLLALEKCKTSDVVKVSANAAAVEPTKMYLHSGEKIKVKDLLFGLMLPSGNDAAIALAEHISGNSTKFAKLMNERAKQLGATNTHFVTPNGLDNGVNHYTTAHDLAMITAYAMKNSSFRLLARSRSYRTTSVSGYSYSLFTTNALWGTVPGLMGVKTGFTNKAGYCFVGAVKGKNGHYYISVTLGAPTGVDRWNDSERLLKYAYNLR